MRRLLTRLLGGRSPSMGKVAPDRRGLLHRLESKLGVHFKDLSLLECALTHRSYLSRSPEGTISNERMEFLGDAVIGLVVSAYVYGKYPEEREGRLTKMKSLAVSGAVFAERAEAVGLGKFLRLSNEESASGGRNRESILADAFEAVVGAVYLDRGLAEAERLVTRILLDDLHQITRSAEHVNYKSLLQELAQARHRSPPEYRVRQEAGPDHHKIFTIEVFVGGKSQGEGKGKSKKEAEQRAARMAMETLKQAKKPEGPEAPAPAGAPRRRRRRGPRRKRAEVAAPEAEDGSLGAV